MPEAVRVAILDAGALAQAVEDVIDVIAIERTIVFSGDKRRVQAGVRAGFKVVPDDLGGAR